MGKGCLTATKYFLFLLNILFFVSISPLTEADTVPLGLTGRCVRAGGAGVPHLKVCVCFQLCGAVIMGFGLWLLLDNQSFIVVLSKMHI